MPPARPTEEMSYQLKGVIIGPPNLAVIYQGSRRFYVRVGEKLDSEYVVQRISADSVVLVGKDRKVILQQGRG